MSVDVIRQLAELQKQVSGLVKPETQISVANRYLANPATRGFWPMSSVDYTAANRGIDLSGQGNHLTANNVPTFGYDGLAPYAEFDGINQSLSRADGGAANWADILGTETYVVAGQRGLTLGGWFYFTNAIGANEGLIAKWGAVDADRSYRLQRTAGGGIIFSIRSAGVTVNVTSTATPGAGVWIYCVGRFIPGSSVDVFVNDEESNQATAEAAIQDTTVSFFIGVRTAAFLNGRASLCFLCAAALNDEIIQSLYQQSRGLFGV